MKREHGTSDLEIVGMTDRHLNALRANQSPWYETGKEAKIRSEWRETKTKLLRWVRRHIEIDLPSREQRVLELHYFDHESYRDIAQQLDIHPSSAQRAAMRGVHRLRCIAQNEDVSWRKLLPLRRRREAERRALERARLKTENTEMD